MYIQQLISQICNKIGGVGGVGVGGGVQTTEFHNLDTEEQKKLQKN